MVFSKVALNNNPCSRNRAIKFNTFDVYLKYDTPLVNYAKDLHIFPLPRHTVDKE